MIRTRTQPLCTRPRVLVVIPVAEAAGSEIESLPMVPDSTEDQQQWVVEVLSSAIEGA